jgi:hypothetical protein
MQDFKFFLLDEQGRSYYVDDSGLVNISTTPRALQYAPDGWQEMKITWERNSTFFGVFRNFTLPIGFLFDGAAIINNAFLNQGIEAKLFFVITKNNLSVDIAAKEYFFYYKFLYKGEIDLSTYVRNDIQEGYKVSVNIMEGGAPKWLKSRQNTTYEIACNKAILNNEVPVRLDGIDYFSSARFSTIETQVGFGFYRNIKTVPLVGLETEGENFYIYNGNQDLESVPNSNTTATSVVPNSCLSYFFNSNNYFFLTSKNLTRDLVIKGEIIGYKYPLLPPDNGFKQTLFLTFIACHKDGSAFYQQNIGTFDFYANDSTFQINATIPFAEMLEGRKCYLVAHTYYKFSNPPELTDQLDAVAFRDSSIKLIYSTRIEEQIIYAKRPTDVFNELTKRLTENEYSGTSDLLIANNNKVITSGNAIRGLENATIKTSLQDFFNAQNVLLNCCLGVKNQTNQFFIESKNYIFSQTNIIDLGEVKDLKINLAKDYVYNSVKIGYPNQSNITTVNGKEEFNNTHQYQLPVNRITKELNLVSPYRADGYGIEQIRKETIGTEKVTNPGDNECFVIEIEDTPTIVNGISAYNVKRLPNGSTIEGLFAQNTAYNIGISPKRLLKNHCNFIFSFLYKLDGKIITFQTTQQNANLKTTVAGVVVEEKKDLTVGDVNAMNGSKLFLPFIFEFDTEVPISIVDILSVSPNASFSFTYKSIKYYGYLLKPSIDISNNEAQQFTLLAAINNDLNTLING